MEKKKERKKEKIKFITAPLKFNIGIMNYEIDFEKLKNKIKKKK